jgi:ABC-2 type transport system permease protein
MTWQQMFFAFALIAAIAALFGGLLASSRVTRAVFARNVASYFSGVLGFLFIVLFVFIAAYLTVREQFFTNNLVNLDQLSEWYPLLLLFIVPAITMSVWADEKKLGTDELLFTLPGTDVQILAGKYLAVLAVYTVALGFSLPLWGFLGWIGDPDWGLIFTTYFGYWIAGAALLSAGMFASVLTSSVTVAFVLGAAICSVPVLIGYLFPTIELFRGLSLREQLRDFEMGMIPVIGLLYFASLAAFMLYLNLVFISRRHWSGTQQVEMWGQYGVRTLSLAAAMDSRGYGRRAAVPRRTPTVRSRAANRS